MICKIEPDEYKVVSCCIDGRECSSGHECTGCEIGERERKREEEQIILSIVDMCVSKMFCGVPMMGNQAGTMASVCISAFMHIPGKNLSSTPHAYGQYVKQDYPDFALLKDRLGLGTPIEVLKDVGKVGVFKYPDKVYICAPFCENDVVDM